MEQYIDKSVLVAEIENLFEKGKCHEEYDCGYRDGNNGALYALKGKLDTFEVKEVDLELITGWFDHIAQIADDRMTLTNQRMTDAHALDEIKCLAKNSSEFITKHYKAQKGE